MDPLKAYFDAATADVDRPWPADTREAVWREVEARATRRRQRRRFAAGALAVAAAAVVALVIGRSRSRADDERGRVAVVAPPRVAPEPVRHRGAVSPDAARPLEGSAVARAAEDSVEPTTPASRFELVRSAGDVITVTLRAGGVRCAVAHRASRRFVVVADDVRVEDRGTRFDVELDEGTVAVTVREGRVDVASGARVSPLAAGQRGTFPRWNARAAAPRAGGSVDAMLAEADARMARSDDQGAIALLRDVTRDHRQHPRAQAAAMRLGRLLRDEGRPLDAARAFEDARAIAPRGPHAEDAVFQEVSALLDGGRRDLAAERAGRYARERPQGLHVDAFRRQGLTP